MSLNSEEKNTAYEKLTPQRNQLVDNVMENLEKGNLFWTQGWVSSGAPESAITGKKYRGINNLFLSLIAMSENYGDKKNDESESVTENEDTPTEKRDDLSQISRKELFDKIIPGTLI